MRRVLAGVAILLILAAPAFSAKNDSPIVALMEGGHWKRARTQVMPRVQANPNDPESAYLLSRVKQAFGDLEGALQAAEKAVALDGNNAEYHANLADIVGEMAGTAGMFKGLSLAHRFKKEAEAAIAIDPKNIDAREGLVDFYLDAPGIAGGDKQKAREIAEEIVKLDATRGCLMRARIAQSEKNLAKQEAAFLDAVNANPKHYSAHVRLAEFYLSDKVNKPDLAEKAADEAVNADAGRAGAYAALAQIYASQGRLAELDALLAQAEKNVPDDLGAEYRAGRTFLLAGKELARAESYFRNYLGQEPEANEPNAGAAHWRLGLVLEKEGRKSEAVTELQAAVRLDPKLEDAKKDLKRLKGN
jgi:tetratricopeptide (TPR) repeat protein